MAGRVAMPYRDRLLEKVDLSVGIDDCWLWTACRDYAGYGRIDQTLAHRAMWEEFIGPMPPKMTIHHKCAVKACCNPMHLEVVTQGENVQKPDGMAGIELAKTDCPHGHPYSGGNLLEYPRYRNGERVPHRRCRACKKRTDARYRRDKKAKVRSLARS